MSNPLRHLAVPLTLVAFAMCGTAQAGTYLHQSYSQYHLDYAKSRSVFDSVGQISAYNREGVMTHSGSGVLLNRRWVLTAAHVVEGGPQSLVFERGNYGPPTVIPPLHPAHPLGTPNTRGSHRLSYSGRTYHYGQDWYTPKQYQGSDPAIKLLSGFDIALIDLGPDYVRGAASFARLPPAGTRMGYGKQIDIVGYGSYGAGAANQGPDLIFPDGSWAYHRRAGSNILDGRLTNIVPYYNNPAPPPRFLPVAPHLTVFDFDGGQFGGNPYFDDGRYDLSDFPVRGEYMHAPGDSGGGIFYGDMVVGIVSAGWGSSMFNSLGINTEVSAFTNWIRRVMAAVQNNDRSQPWLFRRSNFANPLLFDDAGAGGGQVTSGFWNLRPIPEPASVLLLGLGLAGMLTRRCR